MNERVRVLLLGDTHVGLDAKFLRNYDRALEPALRGGVDAVVHGGDVLYRSKVPPRLVEQAFAPLARVANTGVPVYVVPGNHERSRIPYPLLAIHPLIHIFHAARTFVAEVRGVRVAFAGFPYESRVRERFGQIVAATGYRAAGADISLMCMHHCFEGATVGPANYVFRTDPDVVRAADVPSDLAALLSGHIHRHQVLTHDLVGRLLSVPVLYPGSIERTSAAENGETKGAMLVELSPTSSAGGQLQSWSFVPLPARQMVACRRSSAPTRTCWS